MINSIIKWLSCPSCGGSLYYNHLSTLDAFNEIDTINMDESGLLVDKIMSHFLLFECQSCGLSSKYTFRDLEKQLRMTVHKQIVSAINRKDLVKSPDFFNKSKTFVYCGKCNGHDGRGCCPTQLYSICKLKRLPNVK